MINKAWLKVMGLMDKGFNRNFYVTVVVVLLVLTGIGFSFWYTTIQELFEVQKENAVIERRHEAEKRHIIDVCDSTRTMDALRYEMRQDSMNKLIFELYKKER